MKLNGWQRLWVLVIVLWGVFLFGFGVLLYNSSSGPYDDYISELSILEQQPKSSEREKQRQALEQKYSEHIYYVQADKRRALFEFPLLWFVSSIAVYILGWLIAWVIRGFRNR